MRIAYCTNVRLPSERANGHQIAKVVQALRELGHEVEIFAPYRENHIDETFSSYYGLTSPVHLHHLGTIDAIAAWWAPGVLGLKLTTLLFGRSLHAILAGRAKEFDLIYTRTPELLPYLVDQNIPIILELHRIPRFGKGRFLSLAHQCKLIVALTSPMRQALVELGINDIPVIVEGDAVDLHDFEDLPERRAARDGLGVADSMPLIVYTGQLESMGLQKGMPELVGALEILAKRGVEFQAVIAGGPDSSAAKFRATLSPRLKERVNFTGHISHVKIPTLLTAADVLVYPAPKSNHPFYMRDTSPLKIFEYMAAGQPIVTADLPPIHDALDRTMALFVPPGDKESLADAIRLTLDEPDASRKRARLAKAHVEQFTWEKRMERILSR